MIFQYGSFTSETAEALPELFTAQRVYNPRGHAQFVRKTLVVRFDVVKTSQSTVHARLLQLASAFELEGGTPRFTLDAGGDSIYVLPSAGSRGVRIVQSDFWTEDGKAHYATGHPARVTFQAEYTISDADPLVHFRESITRIGNGGQRTVMQELDFGAPIQQIVSQSTPVTVIQSGEAVGASAYPLSFVPPPLYEGYLENPEEAISTESPRIDGLVATDYVIRWNYRMTLNFNPGFLIPSSN
jgi:hypothetical protein